MSNELIDLPESWALVSLAEITHRITKGTTPTSLGFDFSNEGILFVKVESISEQRINHVLCTFIDADANEALARSRLQENDILFSIAGTLGRVAIVHKDDLPANTNQALAIIRLIKPIFPDYIAQALSSHLLEKSIHESGRGVGLQNINLKQVSEFQVPLPPLNEQKRIIAKIEELRDRHQAAKQALEAVPQLCDRFRQSVLAAAFRGDLTADWREENPDIEPSSGLLEKIRRDKKEALKGYREPELLYQDELPELPDTWTWSLPEALSAYESNAICAGPFGTIFKAKDFRDEGIPIIFLRHVAPGRYLTHKPGFMDIQKWEELFKPYSVWGGELLITKLGEPPGVCAIYPEEIGPAMVTPDVIKMTVNKTIIEPLYLMHYFNSELSKKITFGVAYGATRPRMNLPIFRSLPVPLAPLDEQREICKIIQKFFQIADYIEHQHGVVEGHLDLLNQSILTKAFRGELVEQDPNDEPASVLLERIRAEREQGQGNKNPASGKGKRKKA